MTINYEQMAKFAEVSGKQLYIYLSDEDLNSVSISAEICQKNYSFNGWTICARNQNSHELWKAKHPGVTKEWWSCFEKNERCTTCQPGRGKERKREGNRSWGAMGNVCFAGVFWHSQGWARPLSLCSPGWSLSLPIVCRVPQTWSWI